MADFDKEFNKVIVIEGGYVNDPDDSGGETYMGISRKNNPKWIGWDVIDVYKKRYKTAKTINAVLNKDVSLTNSVKLYYKMKYWDTMDLDDVPSQRIAHQMFDTAVNMGVITAIRFAQHCIGMTVTGKFSDELLYNLKQYKQ